jgi:MFS family permease
MNGKRGNAVSELPRTAEFGRYAAAALVFGASASVLVVELVALRLLAPYLGLTLETNTIVIGLALAAIAMGSWAGGRLADRISPRYALGPLLAVSGVAVAATPFAVRGAGLISDALLMTTAGLAIIVPGALLAAVTPMVTKLRLRSLSETGTVVGQVAGIDTAGAIVGTVVTGFVLISRVPVSGIMVGLGAALVIAAAVVEVRFAAGDQRPFPARSSSSAERGPQPCPADVTPRRSTTVLSSRRIPTEPPAGFCCWTARRTPMSTLPTRPTSSTPTQRPWCR